jgi:PAS domain S-box-containing protein
VALVWRPGDGPDYFVSAVEDIQALKESQSLLHEAQHLAGLGHWRWDLKADRHLWSDEIYRIYGRDPSLPPADYPEVRGYFTPESWAGLAAAVEQGLAQGTPWACDAQVVRPDGTRRWIVSRGEAVRDGRGEPLALRGTVQDITERKLAEEALREGEALLRGFFENAEGIVWVKDLAGRFIRVNRYTEQAIGRSRAEILGRTVAEIFPESEADAYAANDRAVLDAGVPMDFEEEARLADGVHSFLSTKYPLRDGEGPVFGLGAICIDITRLKRAEAALKESEETFRSAFANAAIGFALASPQGGILEVNHAYCTITGYRAAELGGLELRHLIHPDDLGPNRALMERMLAGDIADFVAERRLVRRNRSPLWVRTSVSLVRDGQGRPRRVVELVEDISERKSAEEENLKLNADLERRVALRTRELSAANRELDAFAYAVSHDLRAPLRAMSGFSRALVEDYGELLPGEAQGWLDQIGQASRRMGELIDGLLTLSRATRGKPARDPIDLSGMARRVLDELAGVEPGRRVETRVEPGLGARGDPRMIESVLRNLLENAWKYTGRTETPWIRVYGERRDGQPWVCIEDNGAGFSQARAGRLFQVFQRLHRQDEFPGLGIGLATVARILHRHGGRIEATGEPGRGARFCFHLPDEGGDPQES